MRGRSGTVGVLAAALTLAAVTGRGAEIGATSLSVMPTPGLPATLRVLVASDEAPDMFSFEPGGPPGFERALLEGFSRIHGLRLEVVPVGDFAQILPMLVRGEGDVVAGIVDTPAARRSAALTSEVLPVRHLGVTRRPFPALSRPEDLRSRRVGVVSGTTSEQAAVDAAVPAARRVAFADAGALLAGLREGRVDAAVMAVLDFALARQRDGELVAGAFVGPPVSAALAVRPADAPLLEALNGYLQGMRQARQALMFKYLSEEALSLIAMAQRD
jgi:ABC-type amino acid transport substrate-binding protein